MDGCNYCGHMEGQGSKIDEKSIWVDGECLIKRCFGFFPPWNLLCSFLVS